MKIPRKMLMYILQLQLQAIDRTFKRWYTINKPNLYNFPVALNVCISMEWFAVNSIIITRRMGLKSTRIKINFKPYLHSSDTFQTVWWKQIIRTILIVCERLYHLVSVASPTDSYHLLVKSLQFQKHQICLIVRLRWYSRNERHKAYISISWYYSKWCA